MAARRTPRGDPRTIVCIIEAMKLMNEIETRASGRIVKILVVFAESRFTGDDGVRLHR